MLSMHFTMMSYSYVYKCLCWFIYIVSKQRGLNVAFLLLKSEVIKNSAVPFRTCKCSLMRLLILHCQHKMHMVDAQFHETGRHRHESHVIGRKRKRERLIETSKEWMRRKIRNMVLCYLPSSKRLSAVYHFCFLLLQGKLFSLSCNLFHFCRVQLPEFKMLL